MQKKLDPSYILIFSISFILASLLLSDRYSIYYYLPRYSLFYMPGELSSGNIFYEFFRWNLSLIISFLICYVVSKINNDIKFSIKNIRSNIKKKRYRIFIFIILGLVLFFPLLSLLLDYIDLSIGITYAPSGLPCNNCQNTPQIIKIAQGTALCLWIILLFTMFVYQKIKN